MRMKQREDAKHERRNGIQAQSSASRVTLRTADFHRVWLPEPTAADRACEIHRMVAVSLFFDRGGYRMGDVSVLSIKERQFSGMVGDGKPRSDFLVSKSAAEHLKDFALALGERLGKRGNLGG